MGKDKSWKLENTLKIDDKQLTTPKHDKMSIWAYNNMEKILCDTITQLRFQNVKIYKKTTPMKIYMEKSIRNNGFVIGIPDFMVLFNWYRFESRIVPERYDTGAIIEIKPSIKSLGETMRQMQIYKSYRSQLSSLDLGNHVRLGNWERGATYDSFHILVTGSKEYKKIFIDQGFGYFIVSDEMLNGQKLLDIKE